MPDYYDQLPWINMVENTYFRSNWVQVLRDGDAVTRLLLMKN